MRKVRNYSIKKESFEDMTAAKRYNPALEITFRDKTGQRTHKLKAGQSDDLFVYREGTVTYVLGKNEILGYLGLEAFCGYENVGNLFIDGWDVESTVGRFELAPYTIIRRLIEYLP